MPGTDRSRLLDEALTPPSPEQRRRAIAVVHAKVTDPAARAEILAALDLESP
jgi:hypothetical protein